MPRNCEICNASYKSMAYTLCNKCRKKRLHETNRKLFGFTGDYCSGCDKELPEHHKDSTCEKCHTRGKENRNKNRLRKIEKNKLIREKLDKEFEYALLNPIQESDINIDDYDINPYFIGGLIDGDGCIAVNKNGKNGHLMYVNFTQTHLKSIEILNDIFKDTNMPDTTKGKKRKEENKNVFNIRICGKNCGKLLNYLEVGTIRKYENALIAKKFSNFINSYDKGDKAEMEKLRQRISDINQKVIKPDERTEPFCRINEAYITGLFDAEGSVMLKKCKESGIIKHFLITITQKDDIPLIEKITEYTQKHYGVGHKGSSDKWRWNCDSMKILPLLKEMMKYSIIKKKQIKYLIKYIERKQTLINEKSGKVDFKLATDRDLKFFKECKKKIQKYKYQSDTFVKKDIDKLVEEYIEENKNEPDEEEVEIIIEKVSKNVGKNNGNYGKNRSFTTNKQSAINISKSARKKNGITDEKIIEIRKLKINSKKGDQKKTAIKYGVSTSVISNIWNGKTRTFEEIENESLTDFINKQNKKDEDEIMREKLNDENYEIYLQKKGGVLKRALNLENIIKLLKLRCAYIEKEGKNKSHKYYMELFNTENGTKFTLYPCKNVMNGGTKAFEWEFENHEEYEKYLEMMRKIKK